ncbi:CDP-alcohol phosphatidyltransferase family protein [Candidatus Poribacteria bacterium]|nr:CDP-alcohol phosphatidyltransferase family protein [Candidatus Poribacteria bacterium]
MNFRSFFPLANILTFSRLILTVPFIYFFQIKMILLAGIIFGIASFTDYLDGIVARKQGVTSFGSFMDSVVDKILIGAALISIYLYQHELLVENNTLIPIWMVIIIMGREVLITVFRTIVVAKHGEVISANRWGKYKTTSQVIVISITFLLLWLMPNSPFVIHQYGPIFFLMLIPLVLTVVSGLEIIIGNSKTLTEKHSE